MTELQKSKIFFQTTKKFFLAWAEEIIQTGKLITLCEKKNSYAYKIAQFSTTTPILLVVWLTAIHLRRK